MLTATQKQRLTKALQHQEPFFRPLEDSILSQLGNYYIITRVGKDNTTSVVFTESNIYAVQHGTIGALGKISLYDNLRLHNIHKHDETGYSPKKFGIMAAAVSIIGTEYALKDKGVEVVMTRTHRTMANLMEEMGYFKRDRQHFYDMERSLRETSRFPAVLKDRGIDETTYKKII